MGLFDFASNIGKKLFNDGDDDAKFAGAIKSLIDNDNPGVENLEVTVNDGVCELCGQAKDRAAYEKAVLIAGNLLGIKEVKADELSIIDDTPVAEEAAAGEVVYYEIQKGDTLWAIAAEHLGNGAKYTEIFEANREVIQDPDKIYPGQKIRIPK